MARPVTPGENGGEVMTSGSSVRNVYFYDSDREEGKFSPTFGIGVKPGVDWLQFYGRWGQPAPAGGD